MYVIKHEMCEINETKYAHIFKYLAPNFVSGRPANDAP